MNVYCTAADIQEGLGRSTTISNAIALALAEAASRTIDGFTGRRFISETGTRYFDTGSAGDILRIDDLLALTTLKTDSEGDGTYDGESWTVNTDFWVKPESAYPKNWIELTAFGSYSFPRKVRRYVQISGIWGYGDGTASPWLVTAITGTVATTGGLALTLSAAGTILAGQTIKIGDEQLYVQAVTTADGLTTATIIRGVNGTTAATHNAGAISIALYPADVKQAAILMAVAQWEYFGGQARIQAVTMDSPIASAPRARGIAEAMLAGYKNFLV